MVSWGMKKGRGRQKMISVEVIKNKKDMLIRKVTKSMILDRIEWRKIIYVANSNEFVE